ncbi:unnamed protein product [Protopolystoma xenopodis]|uniref:Uncharacterized protein n=1 Tax=Protopolystoma xenopodis TaxID=117903 RepID=A0A3S5CLT8_9PLAT|nr:unnamed protein product [Protopolystoma xenopodis]
MAGPTHFDAKPGVAVACNRDCDCDCDCNRVRKERASDMPAVKSRPPSRLFGPIAELSLHSCPPPPLLCLFMCLHVRGCIGACVRCQWALRLSGWSSLAVNGRNTRLALTDHLPETSILPKLRNGASATDSPFP